MSFIACILYKQNTSILKNSSVLIFLSLTLFLTNCGKDTLTELDCDKLQTEIDANDLINNLNADSFDNEEVILENLVGEWGLIGVVPGWRGFEPGAECIKLTIDTDSVTLEDLNSGELKTSDWELETWEVNGKTAFRFKTDEEFPLDRMGMTVFSENYMFGGGNGDDVPIYIYQKFE